MKPESYNNLFVDCGFETEWSYPEGAIRTRGSNNMLYNNTIVRSHGYGIWARTNAEGRIDDNIIAGAAGTPIFNESGGDMVAGANYTGSVAGVAFVNASADGHTACEYLSEKNRQSFYRPEERIAILSSSSSAAALASVSQAPDRRI